MCFLLQNRSGLLTKERLYSTSVEVATINGEIDKQRSSESFLTFLIQPLKSLRKFILYI